jgi:hypothetical protein
MIYTSLSISSSCGLLLVVKSCSILRLRDSCIGVMSNSGVETSLWPSSLRGDADEGVEPAALLQLIGVLSELADS